MCVKTVAPAKPCKAGLPFCHLREDNSAPCCWTWFSLQPPSDSEQNIRDILTRPRRLRLYMKANMASKCLWAPPPSTRTEKNQFFEPARLKGVLGNCLVLCFWAKIAFTTHSDQPKPQIIVVMDWNKWCLERERLKMYLQQLLSPDFKPKLCSSHFQTYLIINKMAHTTFLSS